jgi:hypothetical protein
MPMPETPGHGRRAQVQPRRLCTCPLLAACGGVVGCLTCLTRGGGGPCAVAAWDARIRRRGSAGVSTPVMDP